MKIKFNSKIKIYDSNNYSITYCNRKIFNPNPVKKKYSYSKRDGVVKNFKKEKRPTKPENVLRSQKRAKERIFDIVYLNSWDYFITLTFNPQKINSFSNCDVMKVVSNWFKYQHKKYGMLYIAVPEFHKSGRIHIHALVKSGFLKLFDSSKVDNNGNIIYNVGSWKLGFSTAIKIYGSSIQLAHYVTKYISKDIVKIFGKYYWSSRNLLRDVPTEYFDSSFDDIDGVTYTVPHDNSLKFKYETNLYYNTKK